MFDNIDDLLGKGKKIIAVDFDGVLTQFDSWNKWEGPGIARDNPQEGAITWLRSLLSDEEFIVCIFSSRNRYREGQHAIAGWLWKFGMELDEIDQIVFVKEKPPAHMFIDDRCYCFQGVFPSIDKIKSFDPWNKEDINV